MPNSKCAAAMLLAAGQKPDTSGVRIVQVAEVAGTTDGSRHTSRLLAAGFTRWVQKMQSLHGVASVFMAIGVAQGEVGVGGSSQLNERTPV